MGRKISKNNDAWTDWLRDEPLLSHPITEAERDQAPQIRAHTPHAAQQQTGELSVSNVSALESPTSAAVSIHIQLPSFKRPTWLHVPYFTKQQIRYWSMFGVVVVVSALVVRFGAQLATDRFFPGSNKGLKSGAAATRENTPLSYNPVVPQNKKELATQGDSAGRYDPSKRLYSYNDTNLGAHLTISQQPLPESFKKNPSEITKAADSINAKHKISTAFGDAYLFSDDVEKGGTQRIVFAYRDMLVFVQSNKKMGDEAWKFYIENLR